MSLKEKIFYYRDLRLFFRIFISSLKIAFASLIKKNPLLLLEPISANSAGADIEKIRRYVTLYTFFLGKAGFKESCFTYSTRLCYILRRSGIDAKVNFGAKKAQDKSNSDIGLAGHCWVTVGDEKLDIPEELIFSYPCSAKSYMKE